MILDSQANWRRYFAGPVWEKAFAYIATLSTDSPEEKTVLDGDALFGIVMRYDTRDCSAALLESHRKYIDIQVAIEEAEGMDWYPLGMIEEKTPYDEAKDVLFYHRPEGAAPAHIKMFPGRFVVFYPEDAHMCQLMVRGAIRSVKKAVVKVRADLVKE